MRASKAVDEIGVVIHGPEVIDSGSALTVLDLLESMGRITVVLGGTMGRVAVIAPGLGTVALTDALSATARAVIVPRNFFMCPPN